MRQSRRQGDEIALELLQDRSKTTMYLRPKSLEEGAEVVHLRLKSRQLNSNLRELSANEALLQMIPSRWTTRGMKRMTTRGGEWCGGRS